MILRMCIVLTLTSTGFSQENTIPQHLNTAKKIGAIAFDPAIDDAAFELCDSLNVEEYYQVNPCFGEGMKSIKTHFESHLDQLNQLVEADGYVIVRFVINCSGNTGRYRAFVVDPRYKSAGANRELSEALIRVVKTMENWRPGEYQGKKYDAYQQLKFHLKAGKIVDILY